jgi:uncharacterized protein YihD (DUF1040 family)
MEDWVDENKDLILNSLYDELSDFMDSKDDLKLILKLVIKSKGHSRLSEFNALAFEFMLVREELAETIDGMLRHFESMEEYEKCAELVKLKKRYEESLKKPIKKARKAKVLDKK